MALAEETPRTRVVVGDFNMTGINWENQNCVSRDEKMFIDVIQDEFWTQHITEPTRHRFGQTPSLQDLVLSNKEEIITSVTYTEPLGKSDQLCLIFTIDVEPVITKLETLKHSINRVDYMQR